jgi:phosphate starvation-inducible protein PhoH
MVGHDNPNGVTRLSPKKNKKPNNGQKNHLEPSTLIPKTPNQTAVIEHYNTGHNLVIHGIAGTGKTFLGCALGIQSVLAGKQDRLIIYRTAVPTRDMGFMPGNMHEKQAPYEEPYRDIFSEIFRRGDAYDVLKQGFQLEFSTTSYIRGLTLRNAVVLVDEMQNWSFHEIDSLMTRLGVGSRLICCGDFRQTDLVKADEKEGLFKFMKITDRMQEFKKVEMTRDDVVRSKLVRSYILAKDDLGII